MLVRRNRPQARRTVYKTGTRFNVGPTAARYLVLLVLAGFSLFYLIQSAQGSDRLIEIRNLERSKGALEKELTSLEVNATRLQSLQSLNQAATTNGLVPVGSAVETLTLPPR
jgi:hypothetical protein